MAFPEARPVGYDADKYWNEEGAEWTATRFAGQGSYTEYVLVISEKGGLYFRAV